MRSKLAEQIEPINDVIERGIVRKRIDDLDQTMTPPHPPLELPRRRCVDLLIPGPDDTGMTLSEEHKQALLSALANSAQSTSVDGLSVTNQSSRSQTRRRRPPPINPISTRRANSPMDCSMCSLPTHPRSIRSSSGSRVSGNRVPPSPTRSFRRDSSNLDYSRVARNLAERDCRWVIAAISPGTPRKSAVRARQKVTKNHRGHREHRDE